MPTPLGNDITISFLFGCILLVKVIQQEFYFGKEINYRDALHYRLLFIGIAFTDQLYCSAAAD